MSDHNFNLIDQPWLSARTTDGTIQEYGLSDLLQNAHVLQELSEASPLVQVAALRLLLAILHRACLEPDEEALSKSRWKQIWAAGKLPAESIDAYLEKWRLRFDLFDDLYPFYQVAGLELEAAMNMNCLSAELSTGNNPTLFDHSLDSTLRDYSPVQALRSLLAVQSFSLAGLLRRKGRVGSEEFYHPNAFNGALPPGAAIWLSGKNLFETLMLNSTFSYDDEADCPCWELDPPWKFRDREGFPKATALGSVDRFTWQSRLVRLLPEKSNGITVVRRCYITQGRSADITNPDPMHAYYTSKKAGNVVVRLSADKASWRDAHALFSFSDGAPKPACFGSIATLIREGTPRLNRHRLYQVHIAGLANDQAKVLLWRHDRFSIPLALLDQSAQGNLLENKLKMWMQWADRGEWTDGKSKCMGMASKLSERTKSVVRYYLSQSGQRNPDPKDVSNLAKALDPLGAYWARLENHFQDLLLKIAEAPDDEPWLEKAGDIWARAIKTEADRAYREAVINGLGESARAIQAVAHFPDYFTVDKGEQ
jgi:CRISPR system Cascade subunit CasA